MWWFFLILFLVLVGIWRVRNEVLYFQHLRELDIRCNGTVLSCSREYRGHRGIRFRYTVNGVDYENHLSVPANVEYDEGVPIVVLVDPEQPGNGMPDIPQIVQDKIFGVIVVIIMVCIFAFIALFPW